MRRALIAVAALLVTSCGGEPDSARDRVVEAADFQFASETVRLKSGGTVEWHNSGRTAHTVKGPGFFSRAIEPGARYSRSFARPGEYDYVCTLHPDSMRGRVVVER